MQSFTEVQKIFDLKLSQFDASLPIAWENTKYTPTLGTAFIRPQLIPTDSASSIISGRLQKVIGFYQIDIFTQAEKGTKEMNLLAQRIFDFFNAQNKLSFNNRDVFILSISKNGSQVIDNWFMSSLTVNFSYYE